MNMVVPSFLLGQQITMYGVIGDTLLCVLVLGNLKKAADHIIMICYINSANIVIGNYKLNVISFET